MSLKKDALIATHKRDIEELNSKCIALQNQSYDLVNSMSLKQSQLEDQKKEVENKLMSVSTLVREEQSRREKLEKEMERMREQLQTSFEVNLTQSKLEIESQVKANWEEALAKKVMEIIELQEDMELLKKKLGDAEAKIGRVTGELMRQNVVNKNLTEQNLELTKRWREAETQRKAQQAILDDLIK